MTVTDHAVDLAWDPYDYGLHADSHPTWRRMREEAPLYYNEQYDFWALTRFDDVLDGAGRLARPTAPRRATSSRSSVTGDERVRRDR